MSDTVKLIVEIPKSALELLNTTVIDRLNAKHILLAVANGIPLNNVKAEIDKAQEPYMTSTKESETYDEGVRFGLMLAYQIVDKAEKGGE